MPSQPSLHGTAEGSVQAMAQTKKVNFASIYSHLIISILDKQNI